jgi:5-formyltetrahydrofolate cyclo-ligase
MTDLKSEKIALRRTLRSARDQLTGEQRHRACQSAHKHLDNWPIWQSARVIASYLPHQSEFDPSGLLAHRRPGSQVAYPRVVGTTLTFHLWQDGDASETIMGGVRQPVAAAIPVEIDTVDLFVTPLLGCGRTGMRLGYGGGFYDRLFVTARGFRLGVGYAQQYIGDWQEEAHDKPLNGFLSDSGLVLFPPEH